MMDEGSVPLRPPSPRVDTLQVVGLTTGFSHHYRARPLDAVRQHLLADLLDRALRRLGTSVVVPGRSAFVVRAMCADDSLAVTVTGPVVVGDAAVRVPILALAVQAGPSGADEHWQVVHDTRPPGPSAPFVTRGTRAPRTPWLAEAPLLAAGRCPAETDWLDAFGRELGWTWIRRRAGRPA